MEKRGDRTNYPDAAWERLGHLLVARRTQIDPSFRSREKFAAETGLNSRLIYDIERAARRGFRDTTLNAIANAYQVTPDAIRQALEDPSTTELPGSASKRANDTPQPSWRQPPDDLPDDVLWEGLPQPVMQVWHIEGLTVAERQLLAVTVGHFLDRRANPVRRSTAAGDDETWAAS
ncbi:helix-turn-helix transcriptional regulator [Thermomonospora umbrina]|uniref:HTH cro/C1-type domain-containing protein n=1 Tax=Thermomonospora umbrina TaxID=111806 RepID=A0A3D9T6D0_9ACTN|nr:helix-turn-helix transcriptional regulator [Thermomonospora umbrina]REF00235.1 hypothetical protein DFJ69_5763 [Thermomonospora umbrina]